MTLFPTQIKFNCTWLPLNNYNKLPITGKSKHYSLLLTVTYDFLWIPIHQLSGTAIHTYSQGHSFGWHSYTQRELENTPYFVSIKHSETLQFNIETRERNSIISEWFIRSFIQYSGSSVVAVQTNNKFNQYKNFFTQTQTHIDYTDTHAQVGTYIYE